MVTDSPIPRLHAIDAFRALTMVLMIFVNDLWSLTRIPVWLEHTAADVDGMGLADWVFPGFLFIVGLSIPFAIEARSRKGDGKWKVFRHICLRSLALWVMGLFMVNLEMSGGGLMAMPKALWQALMILAFVLIWNRYPQTGKWWGLPPWLLQGVGLGLLLLLALTYRAVEGDRLVWMRLHWWGILGLIGWGYFLGATVYLLLGRSVWGMGIATAVIFALNALEFLPIGFKPTLVVGASNYACVLLGVWVAVVGWNYGSAGTSKVDTCWLWSGLGLSAALLIYGFVTRPVWGISKIYGTPSWVAICAGISVLVLLLLLWLCDRRGMNRWWDFIAPAGRSTLTCYLVPYWVYAAMIAWQVTLPAWATTGWVGLMKSLLFALLVVQLTRLLEWAKVQVRI
jgi:heparan-alpha-glucosaminide N-acetyltransferase